MEFPGRFADLVGLSILSVVGAEKDSDRIEFSLSNGTKGILYHIQDCCECVSIQKIEGKPEDLLHSVITTAERDEESSGTSDGSQTITRFKLTTANGKSLFIEWLGESNGYYSEGVDFAIAEA